MTPTVEGAGVELAYEERGGGRAVVLVHGMADSAAGWTPVAEALAGVARIIAFDRRGYGASGAPEPYERTTVHEQAEDAAALIAELHAAPALVCGRDLGALVCLDLACRHRDLLRAVVVIDPPLYAFAAGATEALAAERVALEEALRDHGAPGAVEAYLAAHGAPAGRVARAREDAGAFFADYGGLASWPVTRRQLRGLDVPLAVVTSPAARQFDRAAAAALAGLVPGAVRMSAEDPTDALRALLTD
jgi:pimeloyl-ACP methyl ester carboxylesterase